MTSVFEATEEETTRLIGSPLMHDNYGTEQVCLYYVSME